MKFSLRALFGVMPAVAVYVGILFATPPVVSMYAMVLLSYFLGPVILIGVVYDRGLARTFWIGCLTSGTIPYLWLSYSVVVYGLAIRDFRVLSQVAGSGRFSHVLACIQIAVVLSGLVAVAARRLIADRRLARADATAAGTTPFN